MLTIAPEEIKPPHLKVKPAQPTEPAPSDTEPDEAEPADDRFHSGRLDRLRADVEVALPQGPDHVVKWSHFKPDWGGWGLSQPRGEQIGRILAASGLECDSLFNGAIIRTDYEST